MLNKSMMIRAIIIIGVISFALAISAMDAPVSVSQTPDTFLLQETAAVTPPINLTPPIVVVPGEAPASQNGPWLFLSILVVAGFAFMVAIFALMQHPPQ